MGTNSLQLRLVEHRSVALVGPGRAGTALAGALASRGWTVTAVAGRSATSPSVRAGAERFGARPAEVEDAGRGAALVLVATPDGAIADVACAVAPGLEEGTLVLHLSGACGPAELDKLQTARPDVVIGALHPLQSFPAPDGLDPHDGIARIAGSWCAVDGPPEVERIAISLGLRPFRLDGDQRARYHAAATIASNHLVALMGQVERLAESAGVPPEAFLPLVRSTLDNVEAHGAASALTGPVRRGDAETVRRHLAALPDSERAAYVELADRALELCRGEDVEVRAVLDAVVPTSVEENR